MHYYSFVLTQHWNQQVCLLQTERWIPPSWPRWPMEHRGPPAAQETESETRPRHQPIRERPHHHSAGPSGRRASPQREAHGSQQAGVLDPPPRRRSHRPLRPTHIARRRLHVWRGGWGVRVHLHPQRRRPMGHHRPEADVRPEPTVRRVLLPSSFPHGAVHVLEDQRLSGDRFSHQSSAELRLHQLAHNRRRRRPSHQRNEEKILCHCQHGHGRF